MKPTIKFQEVCTLLLSGLCAEDHLRLSSIIHEEQHRYTLAELFVIRDIVLLTDKIELLEYENAKLKKSNN